MPFNIFIWQFNSLELINMMVESISEYLRTIIKHLIVTLYMTMSQWWNLHQKSQKRINIPLCDVKNSKYSYSADTLFHKHLLSHILYILYIKYFSIVRVITVSGGLQTVYILYNRLMSVCWTWQLKLCMIKSNEYLLVVISTWSIWLYL